VATFSDLFARLDPDPRIRGKQFERICQWFLTNDPTYTARLRSVWLWKEWPDGWSGTEAGIDLVAKDVDGHLWAIQAKAYAEDRPIPKQELNKFLSESNRPVFSYRLLISTTTEGLHHIAQGTVDAQEKPVFILERPDLEASPVQWHISPDDLRPSPPAEPAQPRDYQQDAIREVVDGFATVDRGQLLMACGTGKTLTAWFITDKLAAERTLVLVPSLSLLKQTMREWQNSTGGEVRFASLPVCSDATVAQHDDAPVHTCDLGVPVTTNPSEIATFLRKRGSRVVFATYQSSPQIAKAFELGTVPAFDLVIADEAHRCAGPVSSAFATVLDVGKIKAKRRLFMTATPRGVFREHQTGGEG
jgi:predicted helicase